jgi:ppGpp synthetase/RelA/SpoT-type nucleotidyltranferase
MLNEELFETQKDLEIAKLKYTIESFKKYDIERKQYISILEIEVGKLKSYIEELEGDESVKSLRAKIKNQKEVIVDLRRKLHITEKQLEKFYI